MVADALNRALDEREAVRADLDRVPTTNVLTEKKIAEIVDGLGNVTGLQRRRQDRRRLESPDGQG
jgi:hypothetical protein